ncbi:hypothetical protein DICVIV_04028 [Dictyocaulus viviparus]|uniref:Uncharacterized protein n=1 Tax=Dictyocaulus viviparus TaxID=29172 RepID=A0A0D8Y1D0_DICVI|nr:hypothetical protein DICVIV_04028 [Dictyocaulus viviparus]
MGKIQKESRKRIYDIVNNVTHHSQAVIELLRTVDPELQQLERQLGLLNMKFCTYYEHFAFNKQLRKHAEQILDNFDLSTGKTIDEAASEAPPLLRTKVRLYQIRWRKAIASSRWQKDFEEASKNLANVHECYERFKHESKTKKDQLDICRKILIATANFSDEMKEDLIGLSDIDIMEKIRSEIGMILLRNSISRSRSTSLSSDESCWDNLLSCNYDNIVPSQNSQHHSTL